MRKVLLVACALCYFTFVQGEIVINEIMPSNTTKVDYSYNFGGWIELYNTDSSKQDLYGFYLSDDPTNLKKFRILKHVEIPANGFVVFYCDHAETDSMQTNFDLDCDGGKVYFSKRTGVLLNSAAYPEALSNISYARTVDGGEGWSYCGTPTLASSNNEASFASERCPCPTFSTEGGVIVNTPTLIDITCPEGMEIHYTINYYEPTIKSSVWKGPETIYGTRIYRAIVTADGYLPSPVVTRSYIFDNHVSTLPIMSIVTNPLNLWDSKIGIYCTGTNGITGNGQTSPQNYNQDWDRPANVEYYVENKQQLSQECDITISGGWSRANAMKSLKLGAKKKYDGQNSFDYDFFVSKPGLRYKSLLLRNGGNDFGGTMMKDALLQTTSANVLDVEYQAYQPVVHYINGKYYGIINLRERNNTQYVYSNFGYEKEEIDMVEKVPDDEFNDSFFEVKAGDTEALDELIALSNRIAEPGVYEQVCEWVDVDGLINYLIPELWTGNWDWPQNNIKLFRPRAGGRFRWILYDLENGFGNLNFDHFTDGTYGFNGSKARNGYTSRLMVNLLKNPTFCQRLVDYMAINLGSVYLPERFNAIADSLYGQIAPELPYNSSRWGTTTNVPSYISSFKSFNKSRPSYLLEAFRQKFSLGKTVPLSVSSNHPQASLFLNEVPLTLGYMDGFHFYGSSLTLKAIPPVGYRFKCWETMMGQGMDKLSYGASWQYYDKGSLDNSGWNSPSYSTGSWPLGKAPLGYGNNAIQTKVSEVALGTTNRNPTTYFRTTFVLDDYSADDTYGMEMRIDDGAVVYINGTEVYRYLMPTGNVSYGTYATTYASGNPDEISFSVPASSLKSGLNILAVEVHQHSVGSSDIYLDARLYVEKAVPSTASTDPSYTFTLSSSADIKAVFEPLPENEQTSLPKVRINEVSSTNGTYLNEYFKRNDWVELYNTTGRQVSIAGLYVSNDPQNPQLYQIPEGLEEQTTLPAYGHCILWADKLPTFQQLHLPFKLSAEGEYLCVSHYDALGNRVWCDSLWTGPMETNVSYGRYPDGNDSLYLMNRTTFNRTNLYSPTNRRVTFAAIPTSVCPSEEETSVAELNYRSQTAQLTVLLPAEAASGVLTVFDGLGRLVYRTVVSGSSSVETYDLASLSVGCYVARLQLSNGVVVNYKFMKGR